APLRGAQVFVEAGHGVEQFGGLCGMAGVVGNLLRSGGEPLQPGEQVAFAARDMGVEARLLSTLLVQIGQGLVKFPIRAPAALVVPLLDQLLPAFAGGGLPQLARYFACACWRSWVLCVSVASLPLW